MKLFGEIDTRDGALAQLHQQAVDLGRIESLGIKVFINPNPSFIMVRVVRIGQRLQKLEITEHAAAIFRRTSIPPAETAWHGRNGISVDLFNEDVMSTALTGIEPPALR